MAIWRLQPVARPVSQATGQVFDALRAPAFRSLLRVFAFSGIAAAIPASLVLFFVADVLQAGNYTGLFLGLYFVAGAAGLPFWVWFARRRGKAFAWGAGMLLAVLSFAGAGALGPGDSVPFAIVCLLSGLALGADLALPASMLADLVERERIGAGSCFGWWNFMAKLNLALAAGCALPLLGWLGYVPGAAGQAGHAALAWVYAGVPAFLKLVALGLLWRLARRERES
jgi:Na+/melibiose symporter-like transporter